MEINPTRRVESSSVKRAGRTIGADGKSFAAEEMADAKTAAALTGSGPIAAVDTILALQGIEDSPDSRTRGVNRQTLDAARRKLGMGFWRAGFRAPPSTAWRSPSPSATAEPKLQIVLDEIDLRARVSWQSSSKPNGRGFKSLIPTLSFYLPTGAAAITAPPTEGARLQGMHGDRLATGYRPLDEGLS